MLVMLRFYCLAVRDESPSRYEDQGRCPCRARTPRWTCATAAAMLKPLPTLDMPQSMSVRPRVLAALVIVPSAVGTVVAIYRRGVQS
jgi:hypothetical protein